MARRAHHQPGATRQRRDRPLVVPVGELLRSVGSREPCSISAPLPGLAGTGAAVEPDEAVHLDGHLESLTRGVALLATVRTRWTGACSRCLRPVSGDLEPTVHELFDDRPEAERGEDLHPLIGDEVDCEPVVREAVLLALPLVPLCRDDCQGLCAECGADRNLTSCDCEPDQTDPRWAALDALRFDDDTD